MIAGTCVTSMLYFRVAAFLGAFGRYLYNSGVEASAGTHVGLLLNGREEIEISVLPSARVVRRSYGPPPTLDADDNPTYPGLVRATAGTFANPSPIHQLRFEII